MLCCATPAWAAAQTAPRIPENDAHISIGWAGAEHAVQNQGLWHGGLLLGISGGHYWTDHLKTEVEASWNSPRTRQVYESIERQGGNTFALSDYRSQDIRLGFTQLFQFGRNEWVHPYVGAGADVVRRSVSLDRLPQTRSAFLENRSIPVEIAGSSEQRTTVFAQAVLKTGVKMYVSDRTFFNAEVKVGLRRDVDHVVWRFAMGVDF